MEEVEAHCNDMQNTSNKRLLQSLSRLANNPFALRATCSKDLKVRNWQGKEGGGRGLRAPRTDAKRCSEEAGVCRP